MKSVRDCDRHEIMLRALLVLDATALGLTDPMSLTPRRVQQFIDDVYKVAHAAHGACCETSQQWLGRIDEIAELLKKHDVVDLDEIVGEVQVGKRPKKPYPEELCMYWRHRSERLDQSNEA